MIPQKIRTLRQAKGLTLKELADKTQTTAGYISQLERGLVDPSLSTLRKIAAVLDTPLFGLWIPVRPSPPWSVLRNDRKCRF